MFFEGDYVKAKNKEGYNGLMGKILAYRPPYEVQVLESKKIIYCFENAIQKISKDKFKKKKWDERSDSLILNFSKEFSLKSDFEFTFPSEISLIL
jgi:hypothetical protein